MQPRIPQRVKGVDVMSLPLGTMEGFVLSLVDGRAAVGDIAMITGLEADKLGPILERLADLGAVELPWSPRKPKAPVRTTKPDAHFAVGAARYVSSEADEEAGIPRELRKRILDAHYALDGMNHYQALGVPRSASKEEIRAAYFELSKIFHPDSQFGKELGTYRAKMESVFKRLTEAYDVLGKKKKRADYDEYLATTEQTRRARREFDRLSREVDAIRESTPAPAAMGAAGGLPADVSAALRPPRVPSIATPAAVTHPPAPPSPPPGRPTHRPAPSNEERRARVRERLRQRLHQHSSSRPGASGEPASPPAAAPAAPAKPAAVAPAAAATPPPEAGGEGSSARRKSAVEGLRNSIRASAAVSGRELSERAATHLRKSRDAEQAGDMLSAAGLLQQALTADPGHPLLHAEYERVSKVVARSLAGNYEKQALYEEKTGNWRAAAVSWSRVADNREDDPEAARRAADALLRSRGDLHRAQKYAERAVAVAGHNLQNLVVLARVYLAAGLKQSALRELEKAAKLDPRDQMVNNLLREARS